MSTGQRDGKRNSDNGGRSWLQAIGALLKGVRNGRKETVREEASEEMMQVAQRIEGVVTVQTLRARELGHYVAVEIVISVNPRISVLEGHEIAKRVRALLMRRFLHVTEVAVHVEPYDPGYPYKSNYDPNQEQLPTLLQ